MTIKKIYKKNKKVVKTIPTLPKPWKYWGLGVPKLSLETIPGKCPWKVPPSYINATASVL